MLKGLPATSCNKLKNASQSFDDRGNSGETEGMSRPAIAWINLDHLRHNYRLLKQRTCRAEMMAIVKANAYGHGLNLVAPALYDEGCRNFGVSDAKEGEYLRDLLSNENKQNKAEIVLLSGIFDLEDAHLAFSKHLTPAITEKAQIALLHKVGFRNSVWIKVNSGMNRLGAADPGSLLGECLQQELQVRGIMSHLACADMPEHPQNLSQARTFNRICENIAADMPRSLLNSGGIIAMPEHALDVVRPGIALYGSEPVSHMPLGLKPVMSLTGQVMQMRNISAGESISYGASFTAAKPMRIAVISLGYADGVPRTLSNCGFAVCNGQKLPVTGRVCMDYTIVDITNAEINDGDTVEFWGNTLQVDEVAAKLGTISYTLFTGVGERVKREPVL
jgi:alanine racemase